VNDGHIAIDGSSQKNFTRRAFGMLFLILAAQSMTETARDALFLSRLPATQLPWMYVLVAFASVVVARATTVVSAYVERAILPLLLLAAAAVSCAFWALSGSQSPTFLYALYLWPGVFGSVVIVEFWRAVSDVYTIGEAKRIFGWLGAGASAGAAAGSGLAAALSSFFSATALLSAAGVLMATSVLFNPPFPASTKERDEDGPRVAGPSRLNIVLTNKYLRGVTGCLFLVTVTATFTEFIFKGTLARDLPPAALAPTFASVSLGVNLGAVVLQILLVGPLIRRLGVTRSLAVLPSAMSFAAAALAIGPGAVGAIVARVTDTTIRYSIHKAASDLLYVPLTPGLRAKTKSLIDVLSQRMGQIVASLAIIAVWHLGGGYRVLAAGIVVLAAAMILIAVRLTQPYLDLFRATLRKDGTETRLAYPGLDVASLTSLLAAFNREDERAVVAAMDLVAEERGVDTIPVVMLFHPSRAVVLRALELFEQHRRGGSTWALDRLRREAQDPQIKAAALLAYARHTQDPAALRAVLDDENEIVRTTALVGLVAADWLTGGEAARSLAAAVAGSSTTGKQSLAAAIRSAPAPVFEDTLLLLAESAEPAVRLGVAEAMARMPSRRFMPALRSMLSEAALRQPATEALVALGRPAIDFLDVSFDDEWLPRTIRLHLPGSIRRFAADDAIPILWRRLLTESDEFIRSKILRAIGRLVADAPQSRPDREAIARAIRHVADGGLRVANWRATLERRAQPHEPNETESLLIQLLADEQARAVEAIFQLLGLTDAAEDFDRIYRGLRGSRVDRASGRELLESVLHPSVREVVFTLLDDALDPARLRHSRAAIVSRATAYGDTLAEIVNDSTGVLREVGLRRAGEIAHVSTH
jgi:AAA family ATP:ADP antiporter